MSIATRPTEDVLHRIDELGDLPVVDEASLDQYCAGQERVVVLELAVGIERVPPAVARNIGEADLGIDCVERYDNHVEVVCR